MCVDGRWFLVGLLAVLGALGVLGTWYLGTLVHISFLGSGNFCPILELAFHFTLHDR